MPNFSEAFLLGYQTFSRSYDALNLSDDLTEAPSTTTQALPPTTADNLLTILPWLKNILNENELLSLPSGKLLLGSI